MTHTALPAQEQEHHPHEYPELIRPLLKERVSFRDFDGGDSIMDAADNKDRILFLLSGEAQVVVGYRAAQEVMIESLAPGDVFGDLAFLTGRTWPSDASLVAAKPCRILEIPTDSFQRILRENSEFTVSLLKSLGSRVLRVDRHQFATSTKEDGAESAAVCAYPAHPGLPRELESRFSEVALSGESVILAGELGVGKDMLAYALFDADEHHKEVLVPFDVRRMRSESFLRPWARSYIEIASLSQEQMRFLFGQEVRAADGSTKSLPGYVDMADEGTLFVRGAEQLTAVTQQKLLDALKTKVYCPLGGSTPMKADFRLICATGLDPASFEPERHPLLHELKDRMLAIPPLRDRRDLLLPLAQHYLDHYSREMHKRVLVISELTVKAMMDYSWPGNDLELANAMRRAVLVAPEDVVRRQDLTFDTRKTDRGMRYNLLQLRPIRQALRSPLFPAILQSAFVPLFVSIVLLLFLGPPDPSRNLAAMIMWALAWPGMIVGAIFGARIWCSICAIGALSKLAKRIVALELPFPEVLKRRSDFLIAGGILFIVWVECATDMRSSPEGLGVLLVSMFILAFVLNTLYARQAWCRYLCPLGGMTGVLARTSILELRADSAVCLSRCSSHDCYVGTAQTEGCPFGQVVATLHSNHFCKICGLCVKNCPYDAIELNLRPPGYELGLVRHVRVGTGFLVLGLTGGLCSDMFTRVPLYAAVTSWIPGPEVLRFTVVYVVTVIGVNLLSLAAASLSRRVFRESLSENYSRFGLSVLPLTASGFLAFHLYYLLNLGTQMPALLGLYFNIPALVGYSVVVPAEVTLAVQMALVGAGLVWTWFTMYRLGTSTPRRRYRRRIGVVPHAVVAAILAVVMGALLRAVAGM
ncbi:MAG: sigma 54-interacting transcriptional regulator [Thermodesulfobacteriota bacterium]